MRSPFANLGLAAGLCTLMLLAGCGQAGPLYLPGEEPAPPPPPPGAQPEPAPEPAAPAE